MNEQIKELIKQMDQAETPTGGGAFTLYDTDLEYFAELIVWECMKICEDVMKKDNSALACWSAIKGTFRS